MFLLLSFDTKKGISLLTNTINNSYIISIILVL